MEIISQNIKKYRKEAGITQDELMQKLDKGLEYGGAKRLNESELALISQLEAACDKITSLDESLTLCET